MKQLKIACIIVLLTGCLHSPTMVTGLEGKPLPSFDLLLPDSTTRLNTSNIPEGKPLVLVYFSPTCPYCRNEIESIIGNMKKLKSIQFYLLTASNFQAFKNFCSQYPFKTQTNIILGQDYTAYFHKYFAPAGVPYIAIYDSRKNLKQVFLGKTDITEIREIALE